MPGKDREKRDRPVPPLSDAKLNELAITYVARYSTTRAKLSAYLSRKLRERGWDGDTLPDCAAIADRLSDLGYVNDEGFARAKAAGLRRKGMGDYRVDSALRASGIEEKLRAQFRTVDADQALILAVRFAQRRRIGPFSSQPDDDQKRERWIAMLQRAGHHHGQARAALALSPGEASALLDATTSE